jgi:hypothetical protein
MHRAPTTFFALSTGQGPVRPVQAPRLTKAKARAVPGAPCWPGAPGAPFWPGSPFGPWRPCGPWAPWSSVPLAKSPRCSEPSLTLAELTAFRLDLRCGDRALFQLFRPDAVGGQSDRCVGRTAERDEHAERCHHVRVAEVSSDAIRMHGVRLTHPEKPYKGRPPDRWRISDGLSAGYWAGEVAGERGAGPAHVHGDAGTGRRRSCRRSGTPRSHVPRLPRRGPGVSLARRISRG